ncbi:hypothetical protein PEM37_09160 [Streptomyces sp. AD681]|nr:hypothetical protein [Streptomyces sp. AD681]MDA5141675.1 hypothetical protein [Streptomyces sp. AD681]
MSDITGLEPLATFCGNCNCGCPQLFASIVEEAKAGKLDGIATA